MSDAWLRALLALPFGLAIGSFMTVAVHRLPAGESVIRPRSRCPGCGDEIRSRDNVPVISWLLLRGRCASCGEPISAEYPLLELSTAVLVCAAAYAYADVWVILAVGGMLSLMPAITLIDIRHHIIPNGLMYPSLVAFPGLIVVGYLLGAPFDLARAGLGFVAYGGGLFLIALLSRGMGMGDVKLAGVIGVVLGALGLGFVAVAAAAAILLGALGGIAALLAGRGRKSKIPFGPYMAAGAVIASFWGARISEWYLDRFIG